ncbi:MAG: flagellar hook protein FlgE [Rhodocyclales bacterium]|nr:flagellar hook protein FlgE [Rhodocyclales bacterium]
MAFSNSLSGLIAAGKALDVIGNNIANSQTIGFKSSVARFTNVAAAGKGSGPADSAASAGVSADNVFQNFEQGRMEITNNPLDMAINGQGFFRLYDPQTGKISYTRDGQFRLSFEENSLPRLVTRSGLSLTGNLPNFATDPYGTIDTVPAPVEITIDPYFPPKATGTVNLSVNLDPRVAPAAVPFDPSDPVTFNGSTMAQVFDAAGNQHDLRVYFISPGAGNQWDMYSTLDYDPGNPLTTAVNGPVTLNFDTRGVLATAMPLAAQNYVTTSGETLNIAVDFTGTSQLGTPFSLNALSQNGYGEGDIQDSYEFSVLADGHISARYSNGQRRNVAQVVLANFANPNALINSGDNQWVSNDDPAKGTGTISLGFPNFATEKISGFKGNSDVAEGMGSIQGFAREQSNVDLGTELVALIEQQRNYQASAQTFKILDQVLQNLANMRSN